MNARASQGKDLVLPKRIQRLDVMIQGMDPMIQMVAWFSRSLWVHTRSHGFKHPQHLFFRPYPKSKSRGWDPGCWQVFNGSIRHSWVWWVLFFEDTVLGKPRERPPFLEGSLIVRSRVRCLPAPSLGSPPHGRIYQ